ncbi:MAG TPA: hypothetical protein VMS56_02400 [Thermoanaerobaculia bacterium]|nr:hypothetical protein [Thermoanaerobaculia bacterium]
MRTLLLGVLVLLGGSLQLASQPLGSVTTNPDIARQVWEDTKVIRRVAEVARRDMPRDVLEQIIAQDLDTLRGKSSDMTYRYAGYQRIESGRKEERFGFESRAEASDLEAFALKDDLVYRVRVKVPDRRFLLFRNTRIYVDRVDVTYVPVDGSGAQSERFDVKAWLDTGEERVLDLQWIAREATATLFVRAEPGEKAAVELTTYRATLVDDPASPFATVVRRFQSFGDAIRESDYRRVRNVADELLAMLEPAAQAGGSSISVVAPPSGPGASATSVGGGDDLYFELRHIEDLLGGGEASRREGMERLHRLVIRLRPQL